MGDGLSGGGDGRSWPPKSISPVFDESGKYAAVNQPPKDAWFLPGKFDSNEEKLPIRSCTMPSGKSMLFPVINCKASQLEYSHSKTGIDIIEHIRRDEDRIKTKKCAVDGMHIPPQRVMSPLLFELTYDIDNPANIKRGGSSSRRLLGLF